MTMEPGSTPRQPDYSRIQIVPDQDIAAWWEYTKEKKFMLAYCSPCDRKWFPPFPACSQCGTMEIEYAEIEGKGEIYTYNVVVQPILGHMVPAVPYCVAIVELPDGTNPDGSKTRVPALMRDPEEDIAIGLPVELDWDEHPSQDYNIPRWKLSAKTAPDTWKFPL